MLNLTNSKIFACEVMQCLPKNMFDITKDFVSMLEDMLNSHFENFLEATIQQVVLYRRFGQNSRALEGEIHTRNSVKCVTFSISYDLYPKNSSDRATLTIKRSNNSVIFSEEIKSEKDDMNNPLNKIKSILKQQQENDLIY